MGKSKLYTFGGDSGETSLVGGERTRKDSERLEAYGTLDEFSSFLGVVTASESLPAQEREELRDIQNRLFDIGGYLASDPGGSGLPPVAGLYHDVEKIESYIDRLDSETPKIRAFVLPGGCELSAHVHVARTVCRRAERRIITLSRVSEVDGEVIRYFNRLSDYLFILARYLNHLSGRAEEIWQPGK